MENKIIFLYPKRLLHHWLARFYPWIVKKTLKSLKVEFLKVEDLSETFYLGDKSLIKKHLESVHTVEALGDDFPIIKILDRKFYKLCFWQGDIGLGMAWELGYWTTPDVKKVILWFIKQSESLGVSSGSKQKLQSYNFYFLFNRIRHYFKKNTLTGSEKNIKFHYDLSNEFFKKMLDPSMAYSCAIFNSPEVTLEKAQEQKYEQLCQDLQLREGDELLEIGCGWLGFAQYAVKHYNVKIVCLTISKEQFLYGEEIIKRDQLSSVIDLRLEDYRQHYGRYDKIVSIEMMEALGFEGVSVFMKSCHQLLKKDGIIALQMITCPDSRYEEFKRGVDWIQQFIFPGSLLLSINHVLKCAQDISDLQLYHCRDLGQHYAKTLNCWFENFYQHIGDIKKMGLDDSFLRRWHYYLKYCEAAFYSRNISVVQLVLVRPNNHTLV